MKKVFIEKLPRRGKNYDWKKSLGMKVNFVYDDIQGELEIVNVTREGKNTLVTLKYQDEEHVITTTQIMVGSIGRVVGKNTSSFLYSVGDIVATVSGNMQILEQVRPSRKDGTKYKAYHCKCLKCQVVSLKDETTLKKGHGCAVCGSKPTRVAKDVNSLWKTHNHLVYYFVNEDDTVKYSAQSHSKALMKCPHCGETKMTPIRSLVKLGHFSCSSCSSNFSYPERCLSIILTQLNIDFSTQYSPLWSQGKRYDFYLPDYNMIIETHGIQHYENTRRRPKWKSYEEEHENDLLKFDLSVINGVEHYVVLDCRKSELEWIKGNIMKSKLSKLLNFKEEDIDWKECEKAILHSLLVEANKLYSNGASVANIARTLKICETTCRRYLNIGGKKGLSDYDGKKRQKEVLFPPKRVLCIETNTIYNSQCQCAREMTKEFGIQFSNASISSVCRGITKQHNGYTFKWV